MKTSRHSTKTAGARLAALMLSFLLVLSFASIAQAEPLDNGGSDSGSASSGDKPPASNSATSGLSETETSYKGARLLKGERVVKVGSIEMGRNGDTGNSRYSFWQGDSLMAGVRNPETNNKVSLIAETYWFESSIYRSADFYVMVLKVKTSPNITDEWTLQQENNWFDEMRWDVDTAQYLQARMDPSGNNGGIRWDWSLPFDSYKWEPLRTINIEESYSAGFDAEGNFKEGVKMTDKETGEYEDKSIQAKGYVNADYKVSTQYTVTLHKWQMLVSSASDDIEWQMVVLDGGAASSDNAYHEYFLVIQADKGATVKIDEINFGGAFRKVRWWWFDGQETLSASLKNITFSPPAECYIDDPKPEGFCPTEGVCSQATVTCTPRGNWACNYPLTYQAETETLCDGLDNNCDGRTDEGFPELGQACDGPDADNKKNGVWMCAPDKRGVVCLEDACAVRECGADGLGGSCGECSTGLTCDNGTCVEDRSGGVCEELGETGGCEGRELLWCSGGRVSKRVCSHCCGWDEANGNYACLPADQCQGNSSCTPQCDGLSCGDDGCGGTCGSCPDESYCSTSGRCISQDSASMTSDGATLQAPGCSISGPGKGSLPLMLLALPLILGLALRRRRSR